MLELHISDTDVTSGTIPVSWCLDKTLLDNLAACGVPDPTLIICIAPSQGYHIKKEVRTVVPLKDLMTYIEFHSSGENKIYGIISSKNKKDAENKYLCKNDGEYADHLLNGDGSDYAHYLSSALDKSDPLNVNVPKECFASEPAQWEKDWVNWFFRDKPIDQCHFRKRRLLAYTVQPFWFLLVAIPKLFALLPALAIVDAGIFQVLKTIFKPMTYGIGDAWKSLTGSVLVRTWETEDLDFEMANSFFQGARHLGKKFMFIPLMPISLFALWLLWHCHQLFFAIKVTGIVITAILMIVGSITFFMSPIGKRFLNWFDNSTFNFGKWVASLFPKKATKELKSEYKYWYQNPESANLLVCTSEKKPLTLAALPPKHRTMKLHFQNIKSQVCKPFSR